MTIPERIPRPPLLPYVSIIRRKVRTWNRACFICGLFSWCEHREPELVERWEKGKAK